MATIRMTRDGRYQVDFRVNGVRKRPTFETEKEAKACLKEAEALRATSILQPMKRALGLREFKPTPLRDAIQFYYSNVTKVKKSRRSIVMEKVWFMDFEAFLSKGGHGLSAVRLISDVTLMHLEAYRTYLTEKVSKKTSKPLSPHSINRQFNSIKSLFSKCKSWNMLHEHPCEELTSLSGEEKEAVPWTKDQYEKVYDMAQPWLKDIVLFLHKTGSRPVGAERLKWRDVNFDDQVARIKSLKGRDGKLLVYPVPLTSSVVMMLQVRLVRAKQMRLYDLDQHVFLNASDNPVTSTHICHQVRRIIKQLGLEDAGISAKGLRHGFATSLEKAGVSHDKIRKGLGHTNIRTTQKYLHNSVGDLREAVESVMEKGG